jgi:hypothetical protein
MPLNQANLPKDAELLLDLGVSDFEQIGKRLPIQLVWSALGHKHNRKGYLKPMPITKQGRREGLNFSDIPGESFHPIQMEIYRNRNWTRSFMISIRFMWKTQSNVIWLQTAE